MFEYLNGVIKIKKPEYLAVDVNGIGYRVYITLKTYDQVQVGEKRELYIYNVIKEDTFKLVGFLQERESWQIKAICQFSYVCGSGKLPGLRIR